ncbi:MAG: acyltransferase family protein [Nocardioidaceae bacterium]
MSVATQTPVSEQSPQQTTTAPPRTAPPRTAPPRTDRPGRDPYLDNAKLIAIVLVVVGHSWNNLRDLPLVEAAYLLLYLFHMPAFVLVTGYLSRGSTTLTAGRAQQIVGGVVVPYLLFQTGYGVLAGVAGIEPAGPGLVSPSWLMWFLAALACWRLTAPVWEHMRAPVAVAIACSLAGGVTSSGALALTQVLGLLPFFVLGLRLRPHHLELLRTRAVRLASLGVLGTAAACCYLAAPLTDRQMEWVYWRSSYTELGVSWLEGGLVRVGLLLAALVLSAAFLAWVPRHRTRLTAFGAHTMYAYLLHGLLVLAALGLGVFDLAVADPVVGVPLVTAGAALAACMLMSLPVRRVMQPLVQPDVRALWRRT